LAARRKGTNKGANDDPAPAVFPDAAPLDHPPPAAAAMAPVTQEAEAVSLIERSPLFRVRCCGSGSGTAAAEVKIAI